MLLNIASLAIVCVLLYKLVFTGNISDYSFYFGAFGGIEFILSLCKIIYNPGRTLLDIEIENFEIEIYHVLQP